MLKRSNKVWQGLSIFLPLIMIGLSGACKQAEQQTTKNASAGALGTQASNYQTSVYNDPNYILNNNLNNGLNNAAANPFSGNVASAINSQYIGTQFPSQDIFQNTPNTNTTTNSQPIATSSNISTGSCSFDAAAAEQAVIAETNAYRRSKGVSGTLQAHANLGSMARTWSGELARRGGLVHRTDADLRSHAAQFGLRGVGENLAYTIGVPFSSPTAAARYFVLQSWATSPAHNENMLNSSFTTLGVGFYCTTQGAVYATQNFGI